MVNISLSEIGIKLIGLVLAVVGLFVILGLVGVGTFVSLTPAWFALVVGLVLLAGGIYIIRGGNFTP